MTITRSHQLMVKTHQHDDHERKTLHYQQTLLDPLQQLQSISHS